jgi:hypothetical protein
MFPFNIPPSQGRAPLTTLALIRDALEAGDSCYEVGLRLNAAPSLVRAVFAHLTGPHPEPYPCARCGGAGTAVFNDYIGGGERCPKCRGVGFTQPEA